MPLQKDDFDYSESADYVVTESWASHNIEIRMYITLMMFLFPRKRSTKRIYLQKDVSMQLSHPRSDLITFAIYQRNYPKDSIAGRGHSLASSFIGLIVVVIVSMGRTMGAQ